MFEKLKRSFDIISDRYWRIKAERSLNKLKKDPYKDRDYITLDLLDYLYENIDITVSIVKNFHNLDFQAIVKALNGPTIKDSSTDVINLNCINNLNKLLIALKEKYPNIKHDELNSFLLNIDNVCNKSLFIRFNELLEKLYVYRLADYRIMIVLNTFNRRLGPGRRLEVNEQQALLLETIKSYDNLMVDFINSFINRGIIENIEDLNPESLRLLFEKNSKLGIIKTYEDLIIAFGFVLQKPEHASILLRTILIDIKNQNLTTGLGIITGNIGVEDIIPRLSWLLNDCINNYHRFSYESKIYLDAIIKILNIGNINMISHLRQLAIDLREACEPLAQYREDIHNSPSVVHYYVLRVLRAYLKNGNKDLAIALCKRYNINFSNNNITYQSGGHRKSIIYLNSLESFIGNRKILGILLDLSIALAQVYNINTNNTDKTIDAIENALDSENRSITIKIREILRDYVLFFQNKITITQILNDISQSKKEINTLLSNPNIHNKLLLYRLMQLLESKEYYLALKFKDMTIQNDNDLIKSVEVCIYFTNQIENHKYVKIARASFNEYINNKQIFQLSNAVYYLNKYFIEVIEPLLIKDFRDILRERSFDKKEIEEYLSLIVRESALLPLYEITAKIDYYIRNLEVNNEQKAIERHQALIRFREESREEELKRELAYRK